MVSFEINTKTVLPTEAITGHIFIFAPIPILNMVWSPRSSRSSSAHSLEASVPSDQSHSSLFPTTSPEARRQPWLVTSQVLCVFTCPASGRVLSPKSMTRASPAHSPVPTITVRNRIFSFPATLWRGSLPPGATERGSSA